MLVIKQFGPVTYAMGTLQEILAGTGIAAKVRALPNDVAGCMLEMGADGLWTGASVGTLTQVQADALVASGALAKVKTGTPGNVAGVPYSWGGAGIGWSVTGASKAVTALTPPMPFFVASNDSVSGDAAAFSRANALPIFVDYLYSEANDVLTTGNSDRTYLVAPMDSAGINHGVTAYSGTKQIALKGTQCVSNQISAAFKSTKISAKRTAGVLFSLRASGSEGDATKFKGFSTAFYAYGDPCQQVVVTMLATAGAVLICELRDSSHTVLMTCPTVTAVAGTNAYTFTFPRSIDCYFPNGALGFITVRTTTAASFIGQPFGVRTNRQPLVSILPNRFTTDGVAFGTVPDEVNQQGTILNISFLDATTKPMVLVIGESVTDAYLAGGHVYQMEAKKLSQKDDVDLGGNGAGAYVYNFIGTKDYSSTDTYKSTSLTCRTLAEGRGGWTLYSYMSHWTQRDPNQTNWDLLGLGDGSHTDYIGSLVQRNAIATTNEVNATEPPDNPFFDNSKTGTNRFSITKYLSRYRTLSADGTRLTLGAGTGTQIIAGNLAGIDVCTPTHVFVLLGHNDFGRCDVTTFQLRAKELFVSLRSQLPYADIGIAVTLPLLGTYHPEKYPNAVNIPTPNSGYWYENAQAWNTAYSSLGLDSRQYLIPIYYTLPTVEALNCAVATDISGNQVKQLWGGGPTFHPTAVGHFSIATQLHAWVKYTQTYPAPMVN